MDMGKYNGRLQALEKLRKETMAELCNLEDDLGMGHDSILDSTERPDKSKIVSPRKSPKKVKKLDALDQHLVKMESTADQDFKQFSESQDQLIK
jgi:hypothetical protein